MSSEELEAAIRAVDVQYGLGSGFLLHLYTEDDWSFVIKTHALIEAAVSQLLTHHVGGRDTVRDVTEGLQLTLTMVSEPAEPREGTA